MAERRARDGLRHDAVVTRHAPALRPEIRAALTLRTVLDLSLDEVARAFLMPPRTMEQRLLRARQRRQRHGIEWSVPSGPQLPERLNDVLRFAYLIFTESYAATRIEAGEVCPDGQRPARA